MISLLETMQQIHDIDPALGDDVFEKNAMAQLSSVLEQLPKPLPDELLTRAIFSGRIE